MGAGITKPGNARLFYCAICNDKALLLLTTQHHLDIVAGVITVETTWIPDFSSTFKMK